MSTKKIVEDNYNTSIVYSPDTRFLNIRIYGSANYNRSLAARAKGFAQRHNLGRIFQITSGGYNNPHNPKYSFSERTYEVIGERE